MPKPTKSSASKATRQKHAKKSGNVDADDLVPAHDQPRGKKLSKAQRKALPKVKQYIPPPKPPAPPIPDPLDGQGLARTLPAELVVVLRRLGKKDDVTRRKGVEELKEGWVTPVLGTTDDEEVKEMKEYELLSAIPVWMHNLASLLQSPFHRAAALQLHADLLSISSIRTAIIDTLNNGLLPSTQNRDVVGSWLVAALEEGKRAGGGGLKSWTKSTSWTPEHGKIDLVAQLSILVEYLSLSILDPVSLHDDIHPVPVVSAPSISSKGVKGKSKVETSLSETLNTEDDAMAEEVWARYRVGGLVGLSWLVQQLKATGKGWTDELRSLLENPVLWSALSSDTRDQNLGGGQPPTRRAAYSLLAVVVDNYPGEVEKPAILVPLSIAVLGSCWSERKPAVWETAGPAVVRFLSNHRTAWIVSQEIQTEGSSAETENNTPEDGTDEDDDDEDGPDVEPAVSKLNLDTSSAAFDGFLNFISTICPSIPHLTYPLLMVVISTLPSSLLPLEPAPSPQLKNFFSHLWSPVDARLLSTHSLPGHHSAFQAFLRDAVDCTVYVIGKSWKGQGQATARWLVDEQLGARAWREGVLGWGGKAGRRRGAFGVETEAVVFGEALARVFAIDESLAKELLSFMRSMLLEMCFTPEETSGEQLLHRALPILQAILASTSIEIIHHGVDEVISDLASECARRLSSGLREVHVKVLTNILSSYASLVGEETHSRIASFLESKPDELLILPPDLIASFSHAVASSASNQQAVITIWSLIDSPKVPRETRFALATSVIALRSTPLLSEGSIDTISEEAVQAALAGDSTAISVASACVANKIYLSIDALHTILALVVTSLHDSVMDLLTIGGDVLPAGALEIFAVYAKQDLHQVVNSEIYIHALVAVHHLVVILPRVSTLSPTPSAVDIWTSTGSLSATDQAFLSSKVFEHLASLLGQVSCRVSPGVLVDVALATIIGQAGQLSAVDAAHRLLPSVVSISESLSAITKRKPDITLPIIDPLIPFGVDADESVSRPADFDSVGRSTAARYAEAVLALFQADRRLAEDPELLRSALVARALAMDGQAVPGASRGLYSADVAQSHLAELVREVEGSLSFALSSRDEVPASWHAATIQHLRGQPTNEPDFLQSLLVALQSDIDNDVSARVFRDVLSRHLRQSGAGEAEAEMWLSHAMRQLDKLPSLAQAIILSIKPLLLDTKPFETAQNRLANALTGIPASQANTKGVSALRLLVASAPPADAASVFLPQQRALFVIRHISGWLTSDEADELAEEVEFRVAEVYTALAPIVQDLSGGHWDSIFDLIESGLEGSSLLEVDTYTLLYQSLLLLQQIRDLCATNKSLRALWTSKQTHLGLVLKLFLQCRDAHSVPVQLIQALILDLLDDLTEDAVGDSGMPELCDLLRLSSSTAVQCIAYRILSQVIRRKTLALVLEVETAIADEDGKHERTIALPEELVHIVGNEAAVDWYEAKSENILGQLLAWMAILDHFDDASRTLRWAYMDQLNSTKLISNCLLPMLFAMLGVSEVGAWNFSASSYAVEEFFPDFLQLEEPADLVPLASHIFYRALVTIPSAMRTYYESLKDRQLSMSMLAFTARHYSPTIIAMEFSALREPRAMAQLTEEGLNVRIAQGGGATVAAGTSGGSEAIASYVVDEQPMEIGIRLPAEFPLRGVDVRDLRRVGVPENKWRGWLMSVQQTITSRNGLILEALTVFKKNVALHFEGVVECAICYSIISLTDRTLPTKPCRTCKNRFHASCLFKWFNSSHSSSCPLCRALF